MLVAGFAAVLLAFGLGDPSVERAAPRAAEAEGAAFPSIHAVIDAIVEPVLIVSGLRVVLANEAALKLLGRHVVGEDIRTAIRHPAAAARLARIDLDDPDPVDLAGLGAREQRWQMRVANDGAGHRIVHLIDQTGNYQTEKIRVDFVANASHELRTPLASILGFIETLDDPNAGGDAEVRGRFLKVMFDEARRMQRLVDDLMSLSRIEAEKYRLPDRAVDLAALVEEVSIELAQGGGARVEDIVLDLANGVPPIAGDRAQLSQLVHNLAGNALKYGRAGTPVTLTLRADSGGMVALTVTDQGDGIAPQHLPRLTERFYRVDPGRSRAAGGTGLGLAIVKHIVERHRGRLDIASKLGVGTTVTVLIPRAAEPVSSKFHGTVTETSAKP
ncbi:PAS domain-containing protein [Sphingomonas gilva]|uniref:histidine kinase n=2 Tax=Sphingomonas gilva TaxID=2305907 RepID=A0A396RQE7_9SPHN|nr:PAS domain-containing protein [Sphingomonas gilva]